MHDIKLNIFPKSRCPCWVERFLFTAGVSGLTGEAGLAVVGDVVVETMPPVPGCYPVHCSVSSFVSGFVVQVVDNGLLCFGVVNYTAKWNVFARSPKEETPLKHKVLCSSFESVELMFAYSSWPLQCGKVQGQLLRIGFMENSLGGGILINIYQRDTGLDKIINVWVWHRNQSA